MVGYFAYLTIQHDFLTGGVAVLLTWSFFVLCTPVAINVEARFRDMSEKMEHANVRQAQVDAL